MSMMRGVFEHWREQAACLGKPPSWFYPQPGSGGGRLSYDLALTVCQSCPVQVECLRFARRNQETHGVWGGMVFDGKQRGRTRPLRRVDNPASIALRVWRTENEMSRGEAAREFGVGAAAIDAWERGSRIPDRVLEAIGHREGGGATSAVDRERIATSLRVAETSVPSGTGSPPPAQSPACVTPDLKGNCE